jgi:YVTN family beta-propeller protein
VDTQTNTLLTTVPLEGNLAGIYASPDGQHLFVTEKTTQVILVLNASDYSVITSMPATTSAFYLLSNFDGSKLYSLNYANTNVFVYDTNTLTFLKQVKVGGTQWGAAVTRDQINMYVATRNGVAIINTTTDTLVKVLSTGSGQPRTIAAMPADLKPSNQVALNGGFNGYPTSTSMIPRYWQALNFAASDGKATTIKKESTASIRIDGAAGKTKILLQTLPLGGVTGDEFIFSYWVRGAGIPNKGYCRGQVLLYNGPTLVTTQAVDCAIGTSAAFEKKAVTFSAPAAYTKIVIKFTYAKASGTVWFDMVSLLR